MPQMRRGRLLSLALLGAAGLAEQATLIASLKVSLCSLRFHVLT